MLKYIDTKVTFSEVPDEITLCIGITGCKIGCKGCHSTYLAEDIGEELDKDAIRILINRNKGISCICFMGGDSEPRYINYFASWIKEEFPSLKIAWYSGREKIYENIDLWNFDYIKIGPYKEECGPLNKDTTNQSFFEVVTASPEETMTGLKERWLINITDKFWRNND